MGTVVLAWESRCLPGPCGVLYAGPDAGLASRAAERHTKNTGHAVIQRGVPAENLERAESPATPRNRDSGPDSSQPPTGEAAGG